MSVSRKALWCDQLVFRLLRCVLSLSYHPGCPFTFIFLVSLAGDTRALEWIRAKFGLADGVSLEPRNARLANDTKAKGEANLETMVPVIFCHLLRHTLTLSTEISSDEEAAPDAVRSSLGVGGAFAASEPAS